MTQASTTSQEFFEEKYGESPDPWNFARSEYENHRYDQIMDALGGRRFSSAFEPGCSVGCLTRRLSESSEHVAAIDFSFTAIEEARLRCRDQNNVNIEQASLDGYKPDRTFDLIVFSEIGYYFRESELQQLIARLVGWLKPSGTFLAAHWLGQSKDHLLSGDQVHEIIRANKALKLELQQRHERFRLDRLVRH